MKKLLSLLAVMPFALAACGGGGTDPGPGKDPDPNPGTDPGDNGGDPPGNDDPTNTKYSVDITGDYPTYNMQTEVNVPLVGVSNIEDYIVYPTEKDETTNLDLDFDKASNTVVIYVEGGPEVDTTTTDEINDAWSINDKSELGKKVNLVYLKQQQHIGKPFNSKVREKTLSREETLEAYLKTLDDLQGVAKYYDSMGKEVIIHGHSYGGTLAKGYIARHGTNTADYVITHAARIKDDKVAVASLKLGNKVLYMPVPGGEPVAAALFFEECGNAWGINNKLNPDGLNTIEAVKECYGRYPDKFTSIGMTSDIAAQAAWDSVEERYVANKPAGWSDEEQIWATSNVTRLLLMGFFDGEVEFTKNKDNIDGSKVFMAFVQNDNATGVHTDAELEYMKNFGIKYCGFTSDPGGHISRTPIIEFQKMLAGTAGARNSCDLTESK